MIFKEFSVAKNYLKTDSAPLILEAKFGEDSKINWLASLT